MKFVIMTGDITMLKTNKKRVKMICDDDNHDAAVAYDYAALNAN